MMLGDALYLWRNRVEPETFGRCVKVWLKRIYHMPAVCRLITRPLLLRWRGASIGRLVVLGKSKFDGRLSNLTIGDEAALGRCEIALHDRVSIGHRAVLNDGVLILTASHSLSDPEWQQKMSKIIIGDYVWIASNAIILPGVTIGRGAVVGAGAVVREDVPDYGVVIGNPAQLMPNERIRELNYSPVMLNAAFEAWVGRYRVTSK